MRNNIHEEPMSVFDKIYDRVTYLTSLPVALQVELLLSVTISGQELESKVSFLYVKNLLCEVVNQKFTENR